MDGVFVPNLSYGAMVIERVRKLTAVPFEAHLMIQRPDLYLDSFLAAGCDCITFHIEAVPEPLPLLRQIREADRVAGLAINPGTPAEQVLPFLSECDMVLVMSVEPGFGGQKFMPQVLPKLQAIRASHPEIILSIDGGIALPTIAAAATAGASVFVAGSAVFNEPDYAAAIAELASAASSGHIQGRC